MKLCFSVALALILTAATSHAVPVLVRVVDADNKPVAGVRVEYADNTVEKPLTLASAKTAADGTLALNFQGFSGKPGEVLIGIGGRIILGSARVRDANAGYGVAALFEGENVLTLQARARVSGLITDAAGAPLAGVKVEFVSAEKSENDYSNMSMDYGLPPILATTDAAGRWEMLDLPRGYARFKMSAPDAANDGSNFWIDKAETTAPAMEMRAIGTVRGRILDFAGRPLASIYVGLDDYGDNVQSDAQGNFELPRAPVGENTLNFRVSANNPPADWTGVSDEIKATIAAKGAVVNIGDVRADEGLTVTGLVVDDMTKAPVAGVKLKLDIWEATVQTDAQGRFEARVQKKFYGLKVLGDYNLKTEVQWSPDNVAANKFDVGTIEVERTGATFSGRVTDSKGAAVAGARVGWNNQDKFEFAAIDANGNFKVSGLPFKPLIVRASDGTRLAEVAATPGVPIELKLPPATIFSAAEAETIWEQTEVKSVSSLSPYFEALGNRRVFDRARKLDAKADPAQIGEGLSDYIYQRAQMARTPAERASVASNAYELVRLLDIRGSSIGLAQVAILAARSDDDELREWATRWYEAQKTRVKPLDSPDKVEWYDVARVERVMQVGAILGAADALKYRAIWLVQIDKPNNENKQQYLPEWGEELWQADPKWFDEIVGTWPAPQQMRAIVGALKIELDPARAKALLARLEKLASDPAVVAADAAKTDQISPITQSAAALYQGRTAFARSMVIVDAPAALDALDALDKVQAITQSGETYQIAATVARAAIANGRDEIARRALSFGLGDRYAEGSGALALIARPFDAELAARLVEVARNNTAGRNSLFDVVGWTEIAHYAFALRDFDAGAGRLLLEDQWAKRQQTSVEYQIPDEEYNKRELVNSQEKLAWAMSIYDLPRALQWLSEIKDDRDKWNNGLERTRLAIIVAALTPPEKRSFLLGATYFN